MRKEATILFLVAAYFIMVGVGAIAAGIVEPMAPVFIFCVGGAAACSIGFGLKVFFDGLDVWNE
jgi:hypothetical protein